jgi:ribosomal protein L37AE/L43A
MNPKLTKKLFKKYPELFVGKDKPIKQSLIPLGLDCDDGWYDLIDKLCSDIYAYCEKTGEEIPEATQVKEKYAGLRFYTHGTRKEIHDLIRKAEEESESICEECGKPSKIRKTKSGWYYNRCDECWGIKKLIE